MRIRADCLFFMLSFSYIEKQVLDEIADAQVQMCESIEASLSLTLEAFAGTELQEVSTLKQEAENYTDNAEASFSKFLNSRHAERLMTQQSGSESDASFSNNASGWNKLSDHVGSQIGSTLKNWRATSSAESTPERPRRSSRKQEDPAMVSAITSANLTLTLEQIRLAQATAELQRFRLVKKLVSIKVSPFVVYVCRCCKRKSGSVSLVFLIF